MTLHKKSENDGRAYVPVGNHTPHDSTVVPVNHIAIQNVGDAGAVVVTNTQDIETTLYAAQGQILPVSVKLIKADGTTSTSFALLS